MQDASVTKEQIMAIIKRRGPSLPVHIAKEIGYDILFTSAFLSELIEDKRLRISNMRVGSSPLYFISGQEVMLENFSEYFKNKERETFNLLKSNKFLKDSEQEPAIRVALRTIKDFAIPLRKNEEIYWRYFTVNESEFPQIEEKKEMIVEKIIDKKPESESGISYKFKIERKKEKKIKIKSSKNKLGKEKTNDKFLNRVKEFLSKSSTEIISIEGLKKEELILKIKIHGKEQLLIAYNKKKISEMDIIKAAKKASELKLKYSVLSLGELPKKISELIEALKDIKEIGKVE